MVNTADRIIEGWINCFTKMCHLTKVKPKSGASKQCFYDFYLFILFMFVFVILPLLKTSCRDTNKKHENLERVLNVQT